MNKLQKQRVKNIAKEAASLVSEGKKPNLYQLQQKHGYTESSARGYAVTRTKDWEKYMHEYLPDENSIKRHSKLIDSENENVALRAIELDYRLKGRLVNRSAKMTVQKKINDLK